MLVESETNQPPDVRATPVLEQNHECWTSLLLKSIGRTTLLLLSVLYAFYPAATAQETTPASAPGQQTQPESSNKDSSAKSDGPKKDPAQAGTSATSSGTSKDRLFYALPNFLTLENSANAPPLTARQKYKAVARGAFDYIQIPWYGFLSGISQAENSEPGYGQGAEGYGKRFGSAFADGTIENFMVGAIVPSLLHQDPRFFQSGHGGFLHRTGYAMSRSFVTRTDSGGHEFNFSEIFGGAASAAISTYAYHPSADRTPSNTAKVWGTQLGYDTLTLVIKEFWPDIRRKMHKSNNAAATQ